MARTLAQLQKRDPMDLKVDQKAIRSNTLTNGDVKSYAEMTGDYNPLHFDAGFAAKTRFKELVVQGRLTSGILNALVAMDMPGPSDEDPIP